jgi:hypothetical protein
MDGEVRQTGGTSFLQILCSIELFQILGII